MRAHILALNFDIVLGTDCPPIRLRIAHCLLWNRLLWLTLSLGGLALALARFRPEAQPRRRLRKDPGVPGTPGASSSSSPPLAPLAARRRPAFSSATAWGQFRSQAWLETRIVLRSLPFLLILAFAMISQRRVLSLIHLFTAQGLALALATGVVGFATSQPHLYLSAGLTFALKVLLIPFLLHRAVERLDILRQEANVPSEGLRRQLIERRAIEPHGAAHRPPHADQRARERRLARRARPDDAQRLARYKREGRAAHGEH